MIFNSNLNWSKAKTKIIHWIAEYILFLFLTPIDVSDSDQCPVDFIRPSGTL